MQNILSQLNLFIRKYHFSLFIKNVFFFFTFIGLLVAFFAFVEYSLWLDSLYRRIIFGLLVFFVFCSGIWYFLLPFLRFSRFRKTIDKYKAADIIGNFFPDISDRFRNLLELNELQNVSRENIQLLNAAITQKSSQLGVFHFQKALNLNSLKRSVLFFIPIILGILLMAFVNPNLISQPLERIVKFNTEFEKPAPFQFVLINEELTGVQGNSEILMLKIEGNIVPAQAEIFLNGNEYPMQKTNHNTFQFTIQQLQEDFSFYFKANDFKSRSYKYNVVVKPTVLNFTTEIIYPSYTGIQNEIKKNSTDYLVPQGSKLKFQFKGKDVDFMIANMNEETKQIPMLTKGANAFVFLHVCQSSSNIIFTANNKKVQFSDTIQMFFDVIPDMYPAINIQEAKDSAFFNIIYFQGEISDDYGFTNLKFHVKPKDQKDFTEMSIPFTQQIQEQKFFYMFDFSQFDNWRESEIEYYFSVTDNDAVNGRKTAKSGTRIFKMPDIEQLQDLYNQQNTNVFSDMHTAIEEAKNLQTEIDALRMDLINKKNLNWEDKNRVEQLFQKQQQLENLIDQLINQNEDKNILEELMKDIPEDLLEKQRQLEELFNELFDDEMKEMMKQLQELMQELNKDKIMEQLQEMQLRNEDIEKSLDATMELYKQLEFEKQMNEMLIDLEDLREKLQQLNEETENKSKPNDQLSKEQEQINQEFEKIREEIEDLQQMNEELVDPMDFPNMEELMDEISEDLQEAKDNLTKNKNSNAGKNQKKGSENMQKMQEMMEMAMEGQANESLAEDIENLKRILKNLLHVSFSQESTMNIGKKLVSRDPIFNQYVVNQKKLMGRFKVVEDSLLALGKRQIMVQQIIQNDLKTIRENAAKIDTYISYGHLGPAMMHQQYLLQSVNNLALLLIEVLENMNNMMQQQGGGGGSCNNPNKQCSGQKPGKPSAKTMRQLQEQINQQMEQLMQQMKEGKSGPGGMGTSEQFAKLAAQQEALRRQLQEYSEMLKSLGEMDQSTLQEIMRQMEETERDLVNKKLDINTLKRQNDILVRLMESEKAELEREKDENRTSRTAKVINKSNPEQFFQYKREKTTSEEIIKSIPPMFNSFYRQKVNNFYIELNN